MKPLKAFLIAALILSSFAGFAQIQTINIGSSANDRTGDPIRTAFDKTNDNDAYLDANKIDKTLTRNRQTANYTLVLTDNFKLVEMNAATAKTITVPANASVAFPADDTQISIARYGAGALSIVADVGVTIRSADGALDLRAQYSSAVLIKIGTNEWYLIGDIE